MEIGALIPLITTLAPYVLQFLGSATVQQQVVAAVQKHTGASDAATAHAKVTSDPDTAKALQAQLAKIAADAKTAEQQEQTKRLATVIGAQVDELKARLADVRNARGMAVAVHGGPMEWGAPLVSVLVLAGFTAVSVLSAIHVTVDPQIVGCMVALATTVVSFWVGSSRGSQRKDDMHSEVLDTALKAALPAPAKPAPEPAPVAPGSPPVAIAVAEAPRQPETAKPAPAAPTTAPVPVSIHESPKVAALVAANAKRWRDMHISAERLAEFDAAASRLCSADAKARYAAISAATGVPWHVVAVIHEREAGGPPHWDRQLAQGDPLGEVSTHDPKGLGPFLNHADDPPGKDAFYRAALVALTDAPPQVAKWKDWSAGGTLTILEEFNGLGYANRGVPSAYVWSGSDQYSSGKYVTDHVYDPNTVDVQLGCAPLIARMMALDPTIKMD